MLENEALLKAVLKKPDDDEPRMAYAEWCLTQKDEATSARAKFIRMQVRLRKIFGDLNHPNRYIIQRKTNHQAARYGQSWASGLGGLVDRYEFFGGFVELVTLPAGKFIERAPKIFAQAPIRHLNLTGAHGHMEAIFASPWLQQIRSVALNNGLLTDVDMVPLANSPQVGGLRWLALGKNQIGLPGLRTLALAKNLKSVRYIDFAGNLVDPGEQYSADQGVILSAWLPRDGQVLEREAGPIPWLHPPATMLEQLPPNRFAI